MQLGYQPEDLSNWKGTWITIGHGPSMLNQYRRFRKTFLLPRKKVTSARIKITGETRYMLWVNGQYITRGPAKCYPWYQAYDTVDIAPYLKPGKNVIAVLLHTVGKTTYSNVWREKAGLLVDGEVRFKDRTRLRVDTDNSWKILMDPARSSKGRQLSVQLSFQEVCDGRMELTGWTLPGFNDRKWEAPETSMQGNSPAGTFPWSNMIAREIPQLSESPTPFTGIACFYRGKSDKDWEDPASLMISLRREKRIKTKTSIINVSMKDTAVRSLDVSPAAGKDFSAVVLDLGKTSTGCPRLQVNAGGGGEVIDLFYSARHPDDALFLKPLHPDPDGPEKGFGIIDRYICRKGSQVFEPFLFKGYRYLLLVFRNVKKPLKVRKIENNHIGYPVQHRGTFECSDNALNDIWKLCENGLKVCMLDSYVDCPDREQAQWMFDGRVMAEANFFAFGDQALLRRMIRQCAQNQTPEGLLYGVFPVEYFGLILPDFNLAWLQTADLYYQYTGDKDILAEIFPVAVKNLSWFEKHAGKKKLLAKPDGYWLWLDWSSLKKEGISATFNMQYVLALQAMQRICGLVGRDPAPYIKQEAAVKKALVKTFYDKKREEWFDNLDNGRLTQLSQQVNALAYHAGLPVGKGSLRNIKRSFLYGNMRTKPIASAVFSYFPLEALFGKKEERRALDLIKEGWGFMLENGATSTWETFGGLKGGTVCHGWSAHPLGMMSKYVLGIRQAETGWKSFTFTPTDDKRITWAKGTVPTPYGDITAEWKRDSKGRITRIIKHPKQIKLVETTGR